MTTKRPLRFPAYLKSYVMLAPFFILFGLFTLGPMLYGIAISFTKWNGISPPVFVGLNNYATVINSPRFGKAFSILVLYVAVTVPVGIALAFCIALVVNRFNGLTAHFFGLGGGGQTGLHGDFRARPGALEIKPIVGPLFGFGDLAVVVFSIVRHLGIEILGGHVVTPGGKPPGRGAEQKSQADEDD